MISVLSLQSDMFRICIIVVMTTASWAISIVDRSIGFGEERKALTRDYLHVRYGLVTPKIEIIPKVIVIHTTGLKRFEDSFNRFRGAILPGDRPEIADGGKVNVSSQFMVDRDGTIYRLMPETWMARHVIGLNHCSIGIENVGGGKKGDSLTEEQRQANVELIAYLQARYPTLEYLIGHHEYRCMEDTPLWKEKDPTYRTYKIDPGAAFMQQVRSEVTGLKPPPCDRKK